MFIQLLQKNALSVKNTIINYEYKYYIKYSSNKQTFFFTWKLLDLI